MCVVCLCLCAVLTQRRRIPNWMKIILYKCHLTSMKTQKQNSYTPTLMHRYTAVLCFYTCSVIWSLGVCGCFVSVESDAKLKLQITVASKYVKFQQICILKAKCCISPLKSVKFCHFSMQMAKCVCMNES